MTSGAVGLNCLAKPIRPVVHSGTGVAVLGVQLTE